MQVNSESKIYCPLYKTKFRLPKNIRHAYVSYLSFIELGKMSHKFETSYNAVVSVTIKFNIYFENINFILNITLIC